MYLQEIKSDFNYKKKKIAPFQSTIHKYLQKSKRKTLEKQATDIK